MSSEKSSESTSSSGSGQRWATPFAKRGIAQSFGVYDQAAPNLARLSGNASSLSDQMQTRFGEGAAGAGVARQHYTDLIQRGPQNNPLLDALIAQTRGNVADNVNSQFSLAGRYGSDAHGAGLTRELANAENAARLGDMNTQQGRMDQAAAQLTAANQGEGAQAIGSLPVAASLPYTGTNALAQQLSAMMSGGTSSSTTYAPNPLWGALGAGLGAAGTYFGSERRIKKNIVEVGKLKDGLPVYDFVYRNDPDEQVMRGVMVDEVETFRPWALGPVLNGVQTVNYAHIEPLG